MGPASTVVDGTIQRRLTGGTYDDISVLEQSNNYRYNSSGSGFGITTSWGDQGFGQVNEKFTAAYITGSHSFKAGIALRQGKSNNTRSSTRTSATRSSARNRP